MVTGGWNIRWFWKTVAITQNRLCRTQICRPCRETETTTRGLPIKYRVPSSASPRRLIKRSAWRPKKKKKNALRRAAVVGDRTWTNSPGFPCTATRTWRARAANVFGSKKNMRRRRRRRRCRCVCVAAATASGRLAAARIKHVASTVRRPAAMLFHFRRFDYKNNG